MKPTVAASRRPAAGATELIEWSWSAVPASPLKLRYTVVAPAGTSGEAVLTALVTVVREGVTSHHLVQPEPLRLRGTSLTTAAP